MKLNRYKYQIDLSNYGKNEAKQMHFKYYIPVCFEKHAQMMPTKKNPKALLRANDILPPQAASSL